jgi:hypothetical protein
VGIVFLDGKRSKKLHRYKGGGKKNAWQELSGQE